jgi:hypothetical protein
VERTGDHQQGASQSTSGQIARFRAWDVGKAVASQALRRLVKRGLLKRHRARFVGWKSFYHLPTVEPVERDRYGRTLEDRKAERAEYDARLVAFRERTKGMSEEEVERQVATGLRPTQAEERGCG